ncbi:reverse transcriptase [Senna tora]|uniref:Reverse transcriptase n=1 Tax=Senna tora TaxID=362788 RepID=A0A834VYC3_9FABA|nr:reverse transcriptase [Senna tora]
MEVLRCEEELWASKSRMDWLSLGDANTKFFHTYVLGRRRHNIINGLSDSGGLSANASKSVIWFSPNNPKSTKEDVTNLLEFREVRKLGKYLGFPLVGSVTNAMTSYYMQCLYLPISIYKDIDKFNRNFLWGSRPKQRKLHMVAWNKITKPRKLGGLGIHKTHERNLAILGKLYWRSRSENDSVWVSVARNVLNLQVTRNTLVAKWLRKGKESAEEQIRLGYEDYLELGLETRIPPEMKIAVLAKGKAVEFTFLSSNSNKSCPKAFKTQSVKWNPPPKDLIELNTDGSCIKESEAIGAGVVIRNHDGAWIKGFHIFLGSSSSLLAELWAIDTGIKLAASLNFKNIIVESDNLLAVNMLNDNGLPNIHHMFPLIYSCRSGLNDFEHSVIQHIFREGNYCADFWQGKLFMTGIWILLF